MTTTYKYSKIEPLLFQNQNTHETSHHSIMKGESHIFIRKSIRFWGICEYTCENANGDVLFIAFFSLKTNKGIVYNSTKTQTLGSIFGRDGTWFFSDTQTNTTIHTYDFVNQIKIHDIHYTSEQPRPTGWRSHSLDFGPLNKSFIPSKSNFKLLTDNSPPQTLTLVCGKSKNNKNLHCVTNMYLLHAFVLVCMKHWSLLFT